MANAVILSDCATIKTLRFQERLSEHFKWPVHTFRWAWEGSELNLKLQILAFTHPQVVSHSYDLVSSVEQKNENFSRVFRQLFSIPWNWMDTSANFFLKKYKNIDSPFTFIGNHEPQFLCPIACFISHYKVLIAAKSPQSVVVTSRTDYCLSYQLLIRGFKLILSSIICHLSKLFAFIFLAHTHAVISRSDLIEKCIWTALCLITCQMALQKLIAKKWKEVYNLMAVSHQCYLLMKGFLCCIMRGICVFNKPVINLNQWKEIERMFQRFCLWRIMPARY